MSSGGAAPSAGAARVVARSLLLVLQVVAGRARSVGCSALPSLAQRRRNKRF